MSEIQADLFCPISSTSNSNIISSNMISKSQPCREDSSIMEPKIADKQTSESLNLPEKVFPFHFAQVHLANSIKKESWEDHPITIIE